MFNHNWLMLPLPALIYIWLYVFCYTSGINGQSENAIGAHRVFQKTSFSCTGRPSGYYADIETGCQVYHMCDGLGRQFSYSCPNTTLFQQRMLICDHWYMVNCSRAESDYAANLLIGQRDKPFVNDEENHLRTPRPDLLDRPYAPDYSGESYRNQYKQLPALQNQIKDTDAQKNVEKTAATAAPSQLAPGQHRWKIPPPSRTILPPAYEPQIEVTADESSNSDVRKKQSSSNTRFVPTTRQAATTTRYSTTTTTTRRPTTTTTTTTRRPTTTTTTRRVQQQNSFRFNSAALHQRQQHEHDDLGTSHSTRYNTSADFQNSAEAAPTRKSSFNSRKSSSPLTVVTPIVPIKVPSKIYEPPHLYPIYNENETTIYSTEKPLRVSSATPFTASSITRYTAATTTTTIRPPSRPTTLAGKPFTVASTAAAPPPSSVGRNQNNLVANRFDIHKGSSSSTSSSSNNNNRKEPPRTPTPAQGFKAPTPLPPVFKPSTRVQKIESSALDYNVPISEGRLDLPSPISGGASSTAGSSALPATDLLPPFQEFVLHDDATTQGPPIYYEWKIPSNGLEPPKLDPPIGVDGREYPESVADYNSASDSGGTNGQTSSSSSSTFSSFSSPNRSSFSISSNNPFLPAIKPVQSAADSAGTTRTPTSRSIKDSAQPNSITAGKSTSTRINKSATGGAVAIVPTAPSDIISIRKELSVPEYAFPLEQIGRTGYLSADTYNSFQLKYPERHGAHDEDEHAHWFGENPKCPECHPSYVVPGTCEPCLRR